MKILFDNEEEKMDFFKVLGGGCCPSDFGFKEIESESCLVDDSRCQQCLAQACEWEVVVNN